MYQGKSFLAVVTARGGSKGLPGKNFTDLCGRPLFEWSLLAAYNSFLVDEIYLSTNCLDVMGRWEDNPIGTLIKRPDCISKDDSKNEEALIHSVGKYIDAYGGYPDYVINLQPTSPIRHNMLIDNCIKHLIEHGGDSLITGKAFTPLFWKKDSDEKACPLYNVKERPMRQNLHQLDYYYHEDGNIFITDASVLCDTELRIGKNPVLFETNEYQSLQIDTQNDLDIVKAICGTIESPVDIPIY